MRVLHWIGFAIIVSASLLRAATPPALINYQGVLRDSLGAPRDGNFSMVFRFYDLDSGGNLLLTDTYNAEAPSGQVDVVNGLFTVALGSGTLNPPSVPFASIFADHQALWLEVEIEGETLSPRVRILAAPYAQNANALDGYDAVAFAPSSHAHDTADVTSGTLGVARGGTGLSSPGASANVLTSNGTNWVSIGLPTAETLGAVVDASDTTLTRTGGGYSGNPYKLKLNLDNANTWTGAQTFTAATIFPGSGIWDSTGKVGIGTNSPGSPLQVSYAQAIHYANEDNRGARLDAVAWPEVLDSGLDHFFGLDCTTSGIGATTDDRYLYGIRSSAVAPANWTYAEAYGVEANATGNASGHDTATGLYAKASNGGVANVGVEAHASGSVGSQWGVFGRAEGTSAEQHIGLLGSAEGGSINWAGYFSSGNVHIENYLGIGLNDSSPPSFPLDIQAAQAVARFTSTANAFGSVLVLDNSTASPTYFGAINFNGGAGQIAYTGTGDMTFKTNSTERMRLTASGWLGIGLTPSYQLQLLFDSAAKPNGGSWTNPSDRRLKKDISPFKDGLEVIGKINPVRYRYNGLAGLPRDLQGIGVVAQDVKDVLPYSVGTFTAKLDEKAEAAIELYDFNASAVTFVLINAVKELDERTKGLAGGHAAGAHPIQGEPKHAARTAKDLAHTEASEEASAATGGMNPRSFQAASSAIFDAASAVQAGDVLVVIPNNGRELHPCATAADSMVVGIALEDAEGGKVTVAGSGFTYVKADATITPIAVGDLLVTSPNPGHAMKMAAFEPGTVLGKALESLEVGTGMIKVLVMLR
jgi:hypothetical protein